MVNIFVFILCNFFNTKWNRSRCWSTWENLDCAQRWFQQIKFVSSIVPSPSETKPYNKKKNIKPRNDINSDFFLCWCHSKWTVCIVMKIAKKQHYPATHMQCAAWTLASFLWRQTYASCGWLLILWDRITSPLMKQ